MSQNPAILDPRWSDTGVAYVFKTRCKARGYPAYDGFFVYVGGRYNPYAGPKADEAEAQGIADRINRGTERVYI